MRNLHIVICVVVDRHLHSFSPGSGQQSEPSIPSVISRCQSKLYTVADLQPARNSTATLQLYPVPYSEHSSFFELTAFALSFDWTKMIATVNVGNQTSRGKMNKWFEKWAKERTKRGGGVVEYRHAEYW